MPEPAVDLFGNPVAAAGPAAEAVAEWGQVAALVGVTDRCLRGWRNQPDWRWQLPITAAQVAEIKVWRAQLGLSAGRNDRGKVARNVLAQQRQFKTELLAIDLAERRGEVVSRAEVTEEWRRSVLIVRNGILGLANRIAAELSLSHEQRARVHALCVQLCRDYAKSGRISGGEESEFMGVQGEH